MAEKENKKRKRPSTGVQTPSKKIAREGSAPLSGNIKVSYIADASNPIVISAPDLKVPSISFKAYAQARSSKNSDPKVSPYTHDVLLHSSDHSRLDYDALPIPLEHQLSHYIGIFDASNNQLQITPAHRLHLRSKLRTEEEEKKEGDRGTMMQQREALGREFGTRKALKMIKSKTENAITTDFKGKGKASENQTTILDNAGESAAGIAVKDEKDELLTLIESKPIPKPNLNAESPEEVYTFDTLIPHNQVRMIDVKDWQEKIRAPGETKVSKHHSTQYWIKRCQDDDLPKLKALRYLDLLLEYHSCLSKGGRNGMKIPKREILAKRLAAWPTQLVDAVRKRFSDENGIGLNKWNMDNLYTHICALALYLDGWSFGTDISDLREDLRMETRQLSMYFLELGCKVAVPNVTEANARDLNKAQAANTRLARLKVPLEFPKLKKGRRQA